MPREMPAQWRGCTLVEEDAHSDWRQRAARGVLKDGSGLFERDAGEPLDKVGHVCTVLQILEEGGYGDAGATEDPGPTHACWIALHRWTV